MVYSIDPSVLEVQKGQSLSICGKKSGIRKEDLIRIGSCLHRIDDDKAFIDFIKKS